jgi:hypothetical protein
MRRKSRLVGPQNPFAILRNFMVYGVLNYYRGLFVVKFFVALIGLVLIFEGLPYAAFPEAMRNWLRQLAEARPVVLRRAGLAAVAVGLLLCYVAQRSGLLD